ncbi:PREDICTED: uridine 5'-monophosphate synthase [Ceratosolen solmsi marchali]|uniref:Uridine 5'-monophosphate synthase n=1 Tax=Ceratosolen solmsi marchali TaxID=326594 RepID=A0AAJ6YGU3_9HYME|nr:PREDICTED: uridine 5'-monophosphate synthase [Ceratosolen solmsi marchali]
MKIDLKELAAELYDVGAIKYGNFVTKIGLPTPIYIDLRVIISYPDLLLRISKFLWNLTDEQNFTHICGVPYTALPIATVISTESSIPMLIRRKEAKSYGMKKMVEGVFKLGDRPVIVEDIITSGSSIIETVTDLRKEGLNVNTALVIVDREQGGKKNLENAGIAVKNLFTITELINYLHEAGKLTDESVNVIKDYIKIVKAPLTKTDNNDRLKLDFISRSKLSKNPMAIKLFKLMYEKQTTLCLAADYRKSQEILDLADIAGSHIAVLKIHVDIIEDFEKSFVEQIKHIATKHNFLIMEDRKFADIGQIVSYQYKNDVYAICEWADLITVHPISGNGIFQSIKNDFDAISHDRGIFVVAEMSSEGALSMGNYVTSAITNFKDTDLVTGFVCQKNNFTEPGLIQLTPGVKLTESNDNFGQQYNLPQYVVNSGADLVVVGRGITQAKDKLASVLQYKKILWETYENRIKC